jgi:PAS domain S-box-containing protein
MEYRSVQESFASFWLSRVAIAAMVVYVMSAFRIWRLSPHVLANRLAAVLCIDLALWALQAAISYAADDPAVTILLSKVLSWTWPFFPAIGLHLALEITDTGRSLKKAERAILMSVVYASAAFLYFLLAGPLLKGAIRRAGYWSVDLVAGIGYTAFSIFYLAINVFGIALLAYSWHKSRITRERSMLGIIFTTHAIALAGGFTTDTILAAIGVDFPKVGVLWASIWAIGLNVAIERYGFLAPLSPRDAGLLMDRFIEYSMDGIMVSGSDGKVVYWNAPLTELTGIPASEAIGESMFHLQESLTPAGKDGKSIAGVISRFMETQNGQKAGLIEFQIRRRDGQNRWLQTSAFTIPSAEGDIWSFILRDVTNEKSAAAEALERLQRQSHSQRMEALGALAGGIAHDFNNTLGGIVGAVSLINSCIEDADGTEPMDFRRELEVINRSAQRAASSVRGLMAFAMDRPQRNEPFKLDEPVRRVVEFAGRTFGHTVKVVMGDFPQEAYVRGDSPQVEQLILNLVINANHAMTIMRPIGAAKGGVITLSIRSIEYDTVFAARHPEAQKKRHWALSVSDEGVGMDQKTLSKVFDPFFTTKGTDQGSGLGLSMVHLIAHQHGGFIEAESEPDVGSMFTVFLPAYIESGDCTG